MTPATTQQPTAAEIERLTIENWQLKGALGYPVPGDIPEGPFKCGLCEAKTIELLELHAATPPVQAPAAGVGDEQQTVAEYLAGLFGEAVAPRHIKWANELLALPALADREAAAREDERAMNTELQTALKRCLGLLCEAGDLNNYRNLSNEELGRAWIATAKEAAAVLNKAEARTPARPEKG